MSEVPLYTLNNTNPNQGHGTYYYHDGSQFVGEWKDDLKHGEGTMKHADGCLLSPLSLQGYLAHKKLPPP